MLRDTDDEDDVPIRAIADVQRTRSWAIYGRSGTGKTTFASTFPTPILFLDVRDEGTDSISDVKNCDCADIETWAQFERMYDRLRKKNKYATIVIDTFTQVERLAQRYVLNKRPANKRENVELGRWGSLTRREWGDVSSLLKDRIDDYRHLADDVVFICQERVRKDGDDDDDNEDDTVDPEVGPAVIKSVALVLNANVNMICNTCIKQIKTTKMVDGRKIKKSKREYCMRIGPNSTYITKVRKPKSIILPDYIIDPDYDMVLDIVEGK